MAANPATERIVIPSWDAPPRSLDDWRGRFEAIGHPAKIRRRPDESWLIIESLGMRCLAVAEAGVLGALHVEIDAEDPSPALAALEGAAAAFRWEVHDEDDSIDD